MTPEKCDGRTDGRESQRHRGRFEQAVGRLVVGLARIASRTFRVILHDFNAPVIVQIGRGVLELVAFEVWRQVAVASRLSALPDFRNISFFFKLILIFPID